MEQDKDIAVEGKKNILNMERSKAITKEVSPDCITIARVCLSPVSPLPEAADQLPNLCN